MAITRWIALALVAVSMLVLRVDESFADAGSPADTASASSTASTDQLGEIMVTAEKRDERLRDVPLSVTAATGDQLSLLGIDSAADLEKIVPGFTYRQSQNGTPVFAIRGIGFYSEQAAVAPTVTIYQDQIPLPYARMTEGVPMDVERVEVLKGPQGTLFGQNSTAGAVNYVAAKPKDSFASGVDLTYGRFNEVDAGGYVTGPLTEGVDARLALRHEHRDDWQVNSINPDKTIGTHDLTIGRLLFDIKPTDKLKIGLNLNGWMDRSDTQQTQARGYLPVSALPPHTPQTIATFDALTSYPYVTSDNPRLTDWSPGNYRRRDNFFQVSANTGYAITDDIKLISLTSYAHLALYSPIDADGTYAPALAIFQHGLIKTFTQELRLEGTTARLKWVVGANFERDDTNEVQYTYIQGSNSQVPLGNPFDPATPWTYFNSDDLYNNQQVRDYAGFGNLDYQITDQLSVQGGVRYTKERRDFTGCLADDTLGRGFGQVFFQGPGLVRGQCVTILPNGTQGSYATSLDESNVPWRASINYKPGADTLIYANVTKGYKSGDFGTLPALSYQQFQPVRQESVLAYEAGFKTLLADRVVDLSSAVFYYDYGNKQTQGSLVVPPFGNLPYLVNVPKSHLIGAEFDLTLRPTRELRMSLGGTYIDSKITGVALVASPFGQQIDAHGEELPVAPHWQLQGDAEYRFTLADNLSTFIGANASWRSKTFSQLGSETGPAGTQNDFKINGYALLDLRAGVNFNNYQVQVWGKNVTNRGYWNNVVHIYDTYGRITGQPVTYGVSLSAKW